MQLVFPAPQRKIELNEAGARDLANLYSFPPRLWVRAMMNASIDGRIAGDDGISNSLSNPEDFLLLRVSRALADVIIVGAETVRLETYRRPSGLKSLRTPSLRPAGADYPALVILTNSGILPPQIDPSWPVFLACDPQHRARVLAASKFPAAQVWACGSLKDLLQRLEATGFRGVQIEGGPSVLAQFSELDLLDEICLSTTLVTVSGSGKPLLSGTPINYSWKVASQIIGERALLTRFIRAAVPTIE